MNAEVEKLEVKPIVGELQPVLARDGYVRFFIEILKDTDYFLSFNLYAINCWELDHTPIVEEKEPYLTGYIKWDGCSHFNFGNQGYLHLCGEKSFIIHSEIIIYLFEIAAQLITKWENKTARG